MSDSNPCLSCGACCAHFRVSFFWGECQSAGGLMPDDQVVLITPHRVAMRGTESKPTRCNALLGEVGQGVRCTLYGQRSSTDRAFVASRVDGVHNPHCDAARSAHGLPPLMPPMLPCVSPERVA